MRTTTTVSGFVLIVSSLIMARVTLAIEAGQIDDFENGTTQGWSEGGSSPNPPTNIASGGPEGTGDNYLQNISSGTSGAGGKQVMFNTAQWTGNYAAAEIQSIRMWVLNEGDRDILLRIAIHGSGTWFASSIFFSLFANSGDPWQQVNFPLDANNLSLRQGAASLQTVLGNVDELRILSAASPDFRGQQIAATLSVDNIEAVGPAPQLPKVFKKLISLTDINGNNNTDVGVLRFDPNINKNRLTVLDASSGNEVKTVNFGSKNVRDASAVSDANGDLIPEAGALVEGSLVAQVKDVVNNTLIGSPKFNPDYETIAFLSVGDAGGGNGPDVAVVGRLPSTGRVQAWVKDVASGSLVKRMGFKKTFVPFAAVALDNIGDSSAMEIAVLGINATGKVKAEIRDALTGNLIGKVRFSSRFTPLFFAAVPDANGDLTNLAVLGQNENDVIKAQVKQAVDGSNVSKVTFSKTYVPVAFFGHTDSNGSGGGEMTVVGINGSGAIRAQTKEIADGSLLGNIKFNSKYPPLAAIGIHNGAGTAQNEIALLGQAGNGRHRLIVKDLLTGTTLANDFLP